MDIGIVASGSVGGFFCGFLIGYAMKKIMKILAIVAGLFFLGLSYLQVQQIINVNWNRLEDISKSMADTIINSTETDIPGIFSSYTLENWGLPITGGMTAGVALGFLKG